MQAQRIKSVKKLGVFDTLDFEVSHRDHNFYAEGVIVSNSHSCAYASLAAITVYLKFNHPQEFYLSLLKMTINEPDPILEISKIHKEMIHFGLELLPPSLTHSKMDFSIEGKNIRFGLGSIRGVGSVALEKLNNFKREHTNKFELFQCAKEAGLNVGICAALTQAGCLSNFGQNRCFMVYECQLFSILTEKEKRASFDLGKEFNYNLPAIVKILLERKNEKGKPIITASRFETIKKRTAKYKIIYEQNKTSQDFANNFYENLLCGFVFSKKLKEIYKDKIPRAEYIDKILESKDKTQVEFVGKIVENGKSKISKSASKSPYYEYYISDETATIKVLIFNESLENCKSLHNDKMPQKNEIIIVKGTKKGQDCVFANTLARQLNTVYTSLADIKEDPEDKPKSVSII